MSNYTIGTLAKEVGVGIQTIRFYERKGLLQQPEKRATGYRQYGTEDAQRITFIKRSQDLGFTLKEIKGLLEINTRPRATCADIQDKTEAKLEEIEAKILDLKRMKKSLEKLLKACGDGKKAASECKILDCFGSGCDC